MEVINSFFSNIKDKLTNPFFGTLIIVLLIDYWELWYALFNFDEGFTLNDKIIFIENYVLNNITFWSFVWNIAQAIIFMFAGYLIVVGTRSIVLWIEFYLMPLITGKIINKNVVRKKEYDDVVKEREEYFDQYEEQRQNVRNFSKTIDEQTEQIKLKDQQLLEQSDKLSHTIGELDLNKERWGQSQKLNEDKDRNIEVLTNKLSQLESQYAFELRRSKKYRNLFFGSENTSYYNSTVKFPPEIINKVKELKNYGKWNGFLGLGNFLEYGGSIGGELITDMVERGIIFKRGEHEEFTPLGLIIWKYRKIFENSNSDFGPE
ncbi:hypothetical protein [Aequorivita echinoideorum]|uniref:Uncharacterized protein n=1 Tax=Aequorivita echinoideorum TaxID=1549647 RepID=A0ABS5S736_9FLAO|nr:hypothetical protein [Aequorivita echinoideorum]MBT0608234.1 hypothetical protein [Aequorivita echinoideorum]